MMWWTIRSSGRRTRLMLAGSAAAILAMGGMSGSAAAAILTGVYGTAGAPANLTADGKVDWAIYTQTATASYASANAPPDNRKAAAAVIGNVTPAGNTNNLRGVGGTNTTFTYADGTSPATFAPATVGGIANTVLDTTGVGYQFTVAGDASQTLFVAVYVGGFNTAANTFTATLNGATMYTDTTSVFGGSNPKAAGRYNLAFRPDAAGDLLTIRYTLTNNAVTNDNSHVLLQAVSVSTVPEPATAGILLVGAAGLLTRRRRPHD
jgi:hypothetical protein